jgi:hypothetical protein
MNHSEAIETHAAESYLLGDLVDPQRDAFEEHYFDCRICAETVRAGATLLASGHEVVKEESSFRRFRPMTWVPASIASSVVAAGAVIAIYQGAIIPKIQSVAPITQIETFRRGVAIAAGATRSDETYTVHFEGNIPVDISVDATRREKSCGRSTPPRTTSVVMMVSTSCSDRCRRADMSWRLWVSERTATIRKSPARVSSSSRHFNRVQTAERRALRECVKEAP